MAEYVVFKKKKFKLKKEATAWTKKTKASSPGMGLKIETNYNAGEPMPWEGVILKRK
jgi:hypothetical protein